MDETDDTEMSPEEFLARLDQGAPVTLLKSRAEYEEAIGDEAAPFDSPDSFTMLYSGVEGGELSRSATVPWYDLDGARAEKFISVMLLREHPDGARRRPTQGDGGIDVIVPVRDNPRSWDVYQIKSFSGGSLSSGQRAKIRESAQRLLATVDSNNLEVHAWHLVVPIDPSAKDQEWIESLFKESSIRPHWKGLSYLEGLVAKYRDVFDFYIRDGQERLHALVQNALNLAGMQIGRAATGLSEQSLYDSLSSTLDRLSLDDPHYSYALSIGYNHEEINKAPESVAMSYVMGKPDGAAMRVDVYPKYGLALEDRPITADVVFEVPDAEDGLTSAIERFNIYGDDLTVPSQFASASFSDPVTGDSKMENVEVRLSPRDDGPAVRVRYIVAEMTGERVASTFFDVLSRKAGPSGKGHLFRLRSESGVLEVEQWARTEDGELYNGTFNFKVDWRSRIAARIANDIQFASAIQRGRKLVLAPEFTGPYTDIAHFDDLSGSPVPDWLSRYVEALAELQEYADVPLLTLNGNEEEPEKVVQNAISVASLLHGGVIGQRSPKMGVDIVGMNSEELVAHVNEHGSVTVITPFTAKVANGHVSIPGVTFHAENVAAEVQEVGATKQVVLSSPDGEVTMSAFIAPAEDAPSSDEG